MPIRSGAICCAILLSIAACGDVPLAPQSVAGTWVLTAIDDQPLPALLSADPSNAVTLVADTLRLHLAGSLEGKRCQRRIDYVRDDATDSCTGYGGSYRVDVRTIELAIGCQLGQVCTVVSVHSASLEGDALIVSRDAPGGSLRYRRVPG